MVREGFCTIVYDVKNLEVMITQFNHYVKLSLQLCNVP